MRNSNLIIKFLFILTIIWVAVACVNDKKNTGDSDSTVIENQSIDSADNLNKPILWSYDAVGDSLVKNNIPDSLTIEMVLNDLNTRYKETKLDLVRASGDTVFLKIDDVGYLTRLGSSGNYGFLAEVVYSMTEVPGIGLVHLDFEELDHAVPGLYNREDMNNKL